MDVVPRSTASRNGPASGLMSIRFRFSDGGGGNSTAMPTTAAWRQAASRRARPPRRGWRCPRRTARASLQETVPGTPHSARAPNTARAGAIRRTAKSSWQASAQLPQEGCGLGRMNPRYARLEPRGRHPRLRRHPNPRHVYRQPPRASVRSHPKAHPPCPRHQPSAFSRLRFAICMARA